MYLQVALCSYKLTSSPMHVNTATHVTHKLHYLYIVIQIHNHSYINKYIYIYIHWSNMSIHVYFLYLTLCNSMACMNSQQSIQQLVLYTILLNVTLALSDCNPYSKLTAYALA